MLYPVVLQIEVILL